jgi:hypothetical protein
MTQPDSSYDGDTVPMVSGQQPTPWLSAVRPAATYASGSAMVEAGLEPLVVWPDAAAARPRRTARARAAFVLSALALVLAVTALGLAWRAVERPGRAAPAPGAEGSDGPAAEPGPADAAGKAAPAAPDAVAPPALDGRTVFTAEYVMQPLVLTARCGSEMYADLDEPRGNVEYDGADLQFVRGCTATDPSVLGLGDDVDGSVAGTPTMTPQDCIEKIRIAPVGDATIPVHKGVALCLTTSYAAAQARGESWRVVLLVVTAVADDGAVTLEVTAWNAGD